MKRVRLLLLGLDGLDISVFERPDLPAFRWLRERAMWGTLWSGEKRTGPCWNTLLTGWGIGHHGVTTLLGVEVERGGGKPSSLTFHRRPSDYIFDLLAGAGMRVGVLNFPGLRQSRPVASKGSFMVCGWPDAPRVWPENLALLDGYYTDLTDWCARGPGGQYHKPGMGAGWEQHVVPLDDFLSAAADYELVRLRQGLQRDLDVLMLQNCLLDRAAHMCCVASRGGNGADNPHFEAAVLEADAWLGRVLQEVEPDYIALCSDHGWEGRGHGHKGSWALAGKGVPAGRVDTVDQMDFTPTVLDALGIRVGFFEPGEARRDGQSRLHGPASYAEAGHYPAPEGAAEADDDEAHQRRTLAGLGYVEGEF